MRGYAGNWCNKCLCTCYGTSSSQGGVRNKSYSGNAYGLDTVTPLGIKKCHGHTALEVDAG